MATSKEGSAQRDGGYGWVIMVSFFLTELLVDGIRFSFGIYFVEFLNEFKHGKGETALIGSIMITTYNLGGPIFAFIVNKVGYRITSFIGSIITATGFLLSYFTTDIYLLYFTYGVLQGFGFGLMFLAGTVAIGRYFYRKRARAMGVGLCGAGVGMFIFTPFVRFLIDTYTWRGSMFILAGLSLHGCVLSALYRPIGIIEEESEENYLNASRYDIQSIRELTGSECHINGQVIADNLREHCSDKDSIDSMQLNNESSAVDRQSCNGTNLQIKSNTGAIERCNVNGIQSPSTQRHILTFSNTHNSKNLIPSPNSPLLIDKGFHSSNGHVHKSASLLPRTFADLRNEQLKSYALSAHGSHKSLRSINMSVLSQSVFGSNASFEYIFAKRKRTRTTSNLETNEPQVNNTDTESVKSSKHFSNSMIEGMFPKVLVSNINFVLMMSVCLFAGIPSFIPYSMLPDFAQTAGSTTAQGAWTLSAIGMGGTLSRIGGGWLADIPCVHRLSLLGACFLGCGVFTMIVAFMTSYIFIMMYSTLFGVFFGAVYIVQPIVLIEYLGEDYIAEIMGSCMFVYGISQVAGSPIAGWIFDMTGSYQISFIVAGAFFLVAGIVNFFVLCTKPSREARRLAKELEL